MEQAIVSPSCRLTSRQCARCGAMLHIEDSDGMHTTATCFVCEDRREILMPCVHYAPTYAVRDSGATRRPDSDRSR